MPTRREFYDAVAADHESDLPRLVYADWLDEHGEGRRAEFIRVQCELARLPEADPRRPELLQRSHDLFDPSWPGPHARRRGFPWRPEFQDIEFLNAIERPDWEPCFEVRLGLGDRQYQLQDRRQGWPDSLAANPRLALVAVLADSPGGYPIGPDRFATIAASPHLTGLHAVDLANTTIGPAGVRALAHSPSGFRLRELHLRRAIDPYRRDPAGAASAARLIATHPAFASLESLTLTDNCLGEAGALELAASPVLSPALDLVFDDARVSADAMGRLAERYALRG